MGPMEIIAESLGFIAIGLGFLIFQQKTRNRILATKLSADVIIDFAKAAKACGIGDKGLSGKILNEKYGPYMRYCFIITDAPLDTDEPITTPICDGCGECIKACPGHAITDEGLDSWQCSVYYKGAHRSNPFMRTTF